MVVAIGRLARDSSRISGAVRPAQRPADGAATCALRGRNRVLIGIPFGVALLLAALPADR
jgi:hypothetical protein